jgi:hypothetical protein
MKQEVVVAHFKVMYEHYSVTDATKIWVKTEYFQDKWSQSLLNEWSLEIQCV